jgi:hypothetical protein
VNAGGCRRANAFLREGEAENEMEGNGGVGAEVDADADADACSCVDGGVVVGARAKVVLETIVLPVITEVDDREGGSTTAVGSGETRPERGCGATYTITSSSPASSSA